VNLLAELKRRNVIRMAGLYVVGAWLIVQVAETVLPAFDVPGWVLRALILLLGIGFVPALVVSWLFELTPEGLKRDADVTPAQSIAAQTGRRMERLIFAGLIALIAVIAADRYWPREERVSAGMAQAATEDVSTGAVGAPRIIDPVAPGAIDPGSIAVLPFVNMSADKDNEYFSDGISEELLNVLVAVDGLSVASRTSSFAYKGRDLGAAAIAGELKVAHILEGSVRKSGNRVRITAQLINAGSDRHLWSQTYDRELTDIFAIQDEIANAIVSALREALGDKAPDAPVVVRADTGNLQAYDVYLKARELFIARNELQESVRLFERAVELDPDFARGWEGLAAVTSVIESWGFKDRDYKSMIRPAAERALQLDPTLSTPWAALSVLAQDEQPPDWENALALSDKAIDADPRNATAYLWRSLAWLNLGFFDRAIADLDACLRIDPVYRNCTRWKAQALLYAGDDKAALVLFEEGVAVGFLTNRTIGFVPALVYDGNTLAARLLLERLGVSQALSDAVIQGLAARGTPHPDASALIEPADSGVAAVDTPGLGKAMAYLWLGDFERAAGIEDISSYLLLAWEVDWPAWRASAGFKRWLKRHGVLDYWRAHGFPLHCRTLGESDFECDAPGAAR
jgi:adenylate cyclase